MSLVLVFLLHGLGGSMSSQDAAKLTVNFGKLIRHSLGYGNTGCRDFKWGGGTKLVRFLPKNQHTQRKLLSFEN